jgi:murein L,D-transpeptidase YcbB/YkuD
VSRLAILIVAAAVLAPTAWAQRPAYPIRAPAAAPAPAPARAYNDPAYVVPTDPLNAPLRADQISLLRRALDAAPGHGLKTSDYLSPGLDQQLASREPAQRAEGQRLLVSGMLRYAQAVRAGRLGRNNYSRDWSLRPAAYNASAAYLEALRRNQLAQWIDHLPPPYAGYEALQTGLATYQQIAAAGGWPTIPAGPALREGVLDTRVPLLRVRLAAEDPSVPGVGDARLDASITEGVRRAQRRFGMEPTGIADRATLNQLNVPVQERIGQITANMERWRWMPEVMPADRIQVNIAAAVLTVFRNDVPTMSMRAVTGKPSDPTPILSSVVHSVVLNPPWNVPASIAAKELYPKGAEYLARNNFINIPTGDGGYRLQQKAGPNSALGRIKLDFDNPYAVYLHDTPTRSTFANSMRLASHGCVRLERALDLTRALLEGDPIWTPAAIDQTLAAGQTVRVPLSRPVSVYLLYWTAYLGPDGQMNFRADPYGWDRELLRRLNPAPV